MSLNLSKYNPFNRGKGKMVAGFMLEGWDNDRIFNYIKENQLDSGFKTPLSKDFLYKTRYRLRRDGIFKNLERDKRAKEEAEDRKEAETDLPDSDETKNKTLEKNEKSKDYPPVGRPEWAVMTAAQIDLIEDPALKAQILEYRTYRERQRQAAQTPYVTNEQLNTFKNEVSGRMTKLEGDLIGIKDGNQQILMAINKLTGEGGESNISKSFNSNPQKQQTALVEVAEVEDDAEVILPSMDLETENPLDTLSDDIVELEGSIISTKKVGFTPKSLSLHDLARQKGFQGNFADFVNASIYSAFKGRSFARAQKVIV